MEPDAHLPSTSSAEQLIKLRNVAADWIQTGIELLQENIKTDAHLTTVSSLVPGSTVGKHLRHLHDHFRILLDAAGSSDKKLDYDSRGRHMPMETSVTVALNEFMSLRERLLQSTQDLPSPNLPLHLSAITPHQLSFDTSFGRELPVEFGVAPSTIAIGKGSAKKDKAKM